VGILTGGRPTTIPPTVLIFQMKNTTQIQIKDAKNINVFCYGSNGPQQLCDRIGADYGHLISRTFPAVATGWRRGFKGHSQGWGGCSTATMFETGQQEDTVRGTVVRMTPGEVKSLDPFEGYPHKYYRKTLKLTVYKATTGSGSLLEGFEVESQAYVMPEDQYNEFREPSPAYKIACCKTIHTARTLLGESDNRDITLKVYNAVTKELTSEFSIRL